MEFKIAKNGWALVAVADFEDGEPPVPHVVRAYASKKKLEALRDRCVRANAAAYAEFDRLLLNGNEEDREFFDRTYDDVLSRFGLPEIGEFVVFQVVPIHTGDVREPSQSEVDEVARYAERQERRRFTLKCEWAERGNSNGAQGVKNGQTHLTLKIRLPPEPT